jgi:hypothetical protein
MVDVIALELEDARRRLAAAGVAVATVTETRPPQPATLSGDLRVIRVRVSRETADVVVTRERYVSPAR